MKLVRACGTLANKFYMTEAKEKKKRQNCKRNKQNELVTSTNKYVYAGALLPTNVENNFWIKIIYGGAFQRAQLSCN